MNAVPHAIAERCRVEPIHPAIDVALSELPPAVADRAAPLIRAALATRLDSDRPDRWGRSRLTGDGFPFELSFCTADQRLRFTAEPGAPELAPADRLAAAASLLQRLDAGVAPDIVDACRALQRDAPLTYGAWIGCRVSGEGHALKLYVEVPEPAREFRVPVPSLVLPDRSVVMRMIACSNGAIESYARVPALEPRHVAAVLAPAGVEHRASELLELLSSAYGYSIRGRVPGPSVGVSYLSTGSAIARVTLYLFARSLWGSDARIRRQFVRLAGAHGWDPHTYLQITAPMAARESWQTYHGLVGITLDGSATSLAIGVRPVQP